MSALSVPLGYVLTVSQLAGNRPRSFIICNVCTWEGSVDLPFGKPVEVGDAIHAAVADWLTHDCRGDVTSDMQEPPAPSKPTPCGCIAHRGDGVSYECGLLRGHAEPHQVHGIRWTSDGKWLS